METLRHHSGSIGLALIMALLAVAAVARWHVQSSSMFRSVVGPVWKSKDSTADRGRHLDHSILR